MIYDDFTLATIRKKFGIDNQRMRILTDFVPLEASKTLQTALQEVEELSIRSEKAKSEWIVVPILKELWNRNDKFFTIYSGDTLIGDESKGLKGKCDFILAKDIGTFDINYPIIQIVEAKKNDVEIGVPQCAAQLIGASLYNKKQGVELDKIYGCVTTGNEWLFMVLDGNLLKINTKLYYLNEVDNVLGIFQVILDYYREVLG